VTTVGGVGAVRRAIPGTFSASSRLDKSSCPSYSATQRRDLIVMIHLPEDLERYVQDQVKAGRYPSEDDVVRDALERLRKHTPPPRSGTDLGSIGAMRDAAEELDEIVEHAMKLRREEPWRPLPGE
jgi:putative addiction module CopG family antidote